MDFGSHSTYQFQGIMIVLIGGVWSFGLGLEIPALYSERGIAKIGMLRTDG